MKTLGNLLVIFLVIIGMLALIPLAAIGVSIVFSIFYLAIWFLSFWIIATSDETTDFEKIAWLLAMFCLSWLPRYSISFARLPNPGVDIPSIHDIHAIEATTTTSSLCV